MRERRTALRKSQIKVAEEIGSPVTQTQYAQWEYHGKLPKNQNRLVKLAKALGTTPEELLEKAGTKNSDNGNLIPLIQAMAQSGCESIRMCDIVFFIEVQGNLNLPITPELINSLMRHRVPPPAQK
jgi:transcriptional regulator with XRE-family HTH domain